MNLRITAVAAALVVLLSALAWGCSDTKDLEDQVSALETEVAASSSSNAVDMAAALSALRAAELHAIDEDANDNNTVTAGAAGGVQTAYLTVVAVDWPDELQADADALAADLQELLDALESEDPAVVGPAAAAAHEAQHEFEENVANAIRAAAGIPTVAHEEEEGGETPVAGETPEASATP